MKKIRHRHVKLKTQHYPHNDKEKKLKKGVISFALLFLLLGFSYFVVDKFLSSDYNQVVDIIEDNYTIIDGKKYIKKNNIETYLFMGIDEEGTTKALNSDNPGQCDVLMLFVLDRLNKEYTVVPINRNTMVDTDIFDDDIDYFVPKYAQIALAHAVGEGKKDACKNTMHVVSKLLMNQRIDGYMALNMGGFKIINHDLKGVSVKIKDDFSKIDSSLKKNTEVKLTDNQAYEFIRSRGGVGDQTNKNRMDRQEVYLKNAKERFLELSHEDKMLGLNIYEDLSDYMISNLTNDQLNKMISAIISYKENDRLEIQGQYGIDKEYMLETFELDQDSLHKTIIKLFYEEGI